MALSTFLPRFIFSLWLSHVLSPALVGCPSFMDVPHSLPALVGCPSFPSFPSLWMSLIPPFPLDVPHSPFVGCPSFPSLLPFPLDVPHSPLSPYHSPTASAAKTSSAPSAPASPTPVYQASHPSQPHGPDSNHT